MINYQVCLLLFLRRSKQVILLPGYAISTVVLVQIIGMLPQNYGNYLPFSVAQLQPIFIAWHMLRRIHMHILLSSFAVVYVQPLIAKVFMQNCKSRHLRPNEDPSLFLWALEDILSKADPDLSDAAKQALFPRSLPNEIKLCLLEHDPTPKLTSIIEFVQGFHAFHGTDYEGRAINHAFTAKDAFDAPQDSLCASVVELTAFVATLTANQKSSSQSLYKRHRSRRSQHQIEAALLKDGGMLKAGKGVVYAVLIAISLATMRDPVHGTQCSLCFGWGHRQEKCANNYAFNGQANRRPLPTTSTVSPTSSYSLNFNGVPQ